MQKSFIAQGLIYLILFEPIIFNWCGSDIFVLPKLTFFHILLITFFLVYLVRVAEDKKVFITKSSLFLPILFFLLVNFFSSLNSIHKQMSFAELYNLIAYIIFIFFLINFFQSEEINRLINIILFVAIVVSIYGILQRFRIDFVHWSDPSVFIRPSSSLGNPDFLSAYLCIVLPLVFGKFIEEKKYFVKTVYLVVTSVLFICLLLAFARSGWVSLFFSLTIFFILIDKRIFLKNIAPLFILFLILLFSILFINREKIEIEETKISLIQRATSRSSSINVRLYLWKDCFFLFKMKPLLGCGPGVFPYFYPKHRSPEILRIQAITALPENAHNEFLQIAVTTGILGLFAYLWLLIIVIRSIIRSIRKDNILQLSLFASFISFIVQSLFNPRTPDTTLLFWTILAFSTISQKNQTTEYDVKIEKIFIYLVIIFLMIICVPKITKPLLADIHFRKAEDLSHLNKLDKAIYEYYQAINLNPSAPSYQRAIASFYKKTAGIIPQKRIELYKSAEKEYKKLISLNPLDGSSYADMGSLYLYWGEKDKSKYKKSVSYYSKAIELDPKYAIFHNDLGIVYLTMGDYKKAIYELNFAKSLVPNFSDPYINLGILYYRKGNMNLAIKETLLGLKYEENNPSTYANLGIYYSKIGEKEKAKEYFKKALKLKPKDKALEKLLRETK